MFKNYIYNKFLSEERNETLNSLFLSIKFDNNQSENLIIDYRLIEPYLNDFYSRKNFEDSRNKFSKIINLFNNRFDSIMKKNRIIIESNLFWLSTDFNILEIIDLLYSDNEIDFLICVLQLTSIVENSLANIFVQISEKIGSIACPNMLTDLLNTDIIKGILTEDMVSLLSLFIGSPSSLNLRNLSWHGYLWESHNTLFRYFSKFLLVCLWNIGRVIKESNTHILFNIRKKTTYLPPFITQIETLKELSLVINFDNLNVPLSSIRKVLSTIKTKLFNKNYYQSLSLMLPLFEFYMRMIYIRENNLSLSQSIAVCNEYFVTEDVVSTQFVGETTDKNLFTDVVEEGFCNILIETFIYPSGPRLKDIISHGEVTVVDHDLSSWATLMYNMLYYIIAVHEKNITCEIVVNLIKWLKSYQITYHSYCLVKKDIIVTNDLIQSLVARYEIEYQNVYEQEVNEIIMKDIMNHKLTILFREEEIVSEDGTTLRIVANQLQHIQEGLKFVSIYILEFLQKDISDKKIKNRNNLVSVFAEVIDYLTTLNDICKNIYVRWIIRSDGSWRLMDKMFMRLIKNMVMSVDKVRCVTKKHRWADIPQVTKQFYQVLMRIKID